MIVMKKCECYHTRERVVYDPYLELKRFVEFDGECWGTKEREICFCKGDKCKCDVYPYIKEKALEEKERKQNAEQKDNALKHIKESLEFYLDSYKECGVIYIPNCIVEKMIEELKTL